MLRICYNLLEERQVDSMLNRNGKNLALSIIGIALNWNSLIQEYCVQILGCPLAKVEC